MVKLVWITPDAEKLIGYMARVSNPGNQDNEDVMGLLRYMIRNEHWSPFEMASACFEINTTRDIGRQILRHRSFSFQEFSQRYEDVSKLPELSLRECRLQDTQNRQSSIELEAGDSLAWKWQHQQQVLKTLAVDVYRWALVNGVAKEQARAVLPEGLTPSRMYMSGTLRSWMHYVKLRTDPSTQKEHRLIAEEIGKVLAEQVPTIWEAWSAK
jgi:thymidylate synthase (FAD)